MPSSQQHYGRTLEIWAENHAVPFDESAATFRGQWGITVCHERSFWSSDELVVLLILPTGEGLSHYGDASPRDYNLMTRNI